MTAAGETAAARMGKTSGDRARTTGMPARNPFQGKSPELAAAWRRAYLTAAKPKTMRRR